MKTIRVAETLLTIVFSALIVFHLLIMTSVIPYDMVWGSRLSSYQQMIIFEVVSLVLNLLFLLIILMHAGKIKAVLPPKVIKGLIWVMMGLFILNTIGNLASDNTFERMVFTPITVLLASCLFLVAKAKKPNITSH